MSHWPRNWAVRILVGIWSLPTMVLGFLFYLGPLLAFRQLTWRGWREGAWDLTVEPGSRMSKSNWSAFSLGWFVVYTSENSYKDQRTRLHERVHLKQQLILGLIHWVFYAQMSVVIWLACRSLHSYSANPFELDARRQAGEAIGGLGPEAGNDRWPWW